MKARFHFATKRKFMISWSNQTDRMVVAQAKKRGVIKQEVLRSVMIPEWLEDQKAKEKAKQKRQ